MIDKNTVFNLIEESINDDEIRMLVNMLNRLWREDKILMNSDDWPILSELVADTRKRNNINQQQ